MDLKKPKRAKKTQHDKFVELAREVGADESEAAFVGKLRRIATPLTPAERDSLRREAKEDSAFFRKAFARQRPKKD